MQEPTHILAGVIIQRSFEPVRPRALGLGLTAVFAFLSHGLLDRLANITYHPPNADFHDPFWVCFHSGVLICTIVFLVLWWRRYWWGILFAALPDLDWVFIHGQQIFHVNIPFYQTPHFHDFLHIVFNETWPFSLMRIPSGRHNPWACLYEVALVAAMLIAIHFLTKGKPRPVTEAPKPAPQQT